MAAPDGTSDGVGWLTRERLVSWVRSTPPGGTCVLSAPAGYGKAALARAATAGSPVTDWMPTGTATEGDGDPPSSPRVVLAQLAEGGGGWLRVPSLGPAGEDAVHSELKAALVSCPPSCRILVITDRPPGSLFAELRLAGRLVEIDPGDLRLSVDESQTVLRQHAPGLSAADREQLLLLCDGWLAALLLVAHRHAQHPDEDPVAWLRARGAELLMDPWLEDQDAATVEMLISTAFLDVLHPDLVDEILPGTGAGNALLRAAREAGPISPSRFTGHRGRIGFLRHPLLTERLRVLALARPASPELHVRAAGWLHRHDDLAGELENLFAAGQHRLAAERLYAHEDELLASGRARQALRWYESVADAPPSSVITHELRIGWAQALAGDIVDARSTLGRLSASLSTASSVTPAPQDYASLEGELAVLACWISHAEGDVKEALSASRKAQACFGEDLSRNSHLLAALYGARALTVLGRWAEADAVLVPVRLTTFALTAISEGTRAEIEAELAWEQGRLHECRSWAARRARWAGDTDVTTMPANRPPLARWLAEAEAGRAGEATAGLLRVLEPSDRVAPNVTDDVLARVALAEVHRGAGRYGPALTVLAEARAIVHLRSPLGGLGDRIARLEARVRLLGGDPVRAARALRDLPPVQDVLLLRIRLALHRDAFSARQLLREFEPSSPREEAEWAVLSAWAHMDRSRADAERHLLNAADIAAAHGMSTTLVGEPAPVLRLARATAQHFVHDALSELVTTAEDASSPTYARDSAATVSLTRGELQLIPLLQTRMTNADIAEHLGVSVNTVKTRVRRLFAKLGVRDRRGASQLLASLGLAGSPTDSRSRLNSTDERTRAEPPHTSP